MTRVLASPRELRVPPEFRVTHVEDWEYAMARPDARVWVPDGAHPLAPRECPIMRCTRDFVLDAEPPVWMATYLPHVRDCTPPSGRQFVSLERGWLVIHTMRTTNSWNSKMAWTARDSELYDPPTMRDLDRDAGVEGVMKLWETLENS